MATSRPKRPKAPPPRLNLEEMEHDPSMRGMLSFLEISPAEKLEMLRKRAEVDETSVIPFPAPHSAPKVGAPEVLSEVETRSTAKVGASISGAPELGAPEVAAPDSSPEPAPVIRPAPEAGAPKPDAPEFGAPQLEDVYVYRPQRPVLHPAVTAQDGHTHGEQALFATLWRLARPSGPGNFRAISIGERTLAAEVPMAYSTVQENARSLAAKLAIEIRVNGARQPKTYIVYPYDEILRRRRAAGLTHVIRKTSGVLLVRPDAVKVGAPTSGAPSVNSGAASSVTPDFTSGAPGFGSSGAPDLGDRIKNKEINSGTTPSSGSWPLAVRALLDTMGHGDDDAIRRMAEGALENAPDATDEELAGFIREEAPRVQRNRALENPMGMLIRQVPRRFLGEALRIHREDVRRRKDMEAALQRERLAEALRILEDPGSCETDREWARQCIAGQEEHGEGKTQAEPVTP